MPASNSAIEATKRNRAMMHKPSLYENMKRYGKSPYTVIIEGGNLEKRESADLTKQMQLAKKKGVIKELKFYTLSVVISIGLFYTLYLIFF